MKKDLTELVFILDKSGSMYGLEQDTVGGFNSMIKKQKAEQGEALVNAVLFNSEQEVIYDRVPIGKVEPMDERQYRVGGCTALYDAIGHAIRHMDKVYKYIRKEDVPEKTVFVITTDGMENSSYCFGLTELRKLVKEHEKKGWEFLFLGANIDAPEVAYSMGMRRDRAVRYESDSVGTALNYEVISETLSDMRLGKNIDESWKKRIEEDRQKRGKH